ncbi:MAG: universal stress protein [Dehalococcoidales bacterium]|nr:MAG: universal stress protein [Dehalococcoidales bacterium]
MYQHIMVPLDGSELAECVLPHVESIATGCNVTSVTLVMAVPPLHMYGGAETRISPEEREHLEKDSVGVATTYLEEKARLLRDKGVMVETTVLFGNVLEQLVEYTKNNSVDLIIIATHGRSGVSRLFLGSVAERLFRQAPVPVLMVRAPGSEHDD